MMSKIVRAAAAAAAAAALALAPSMSATAAEPQLVQASHAKPGYNGKAVTKTSLKLIRTVGRQGHWTAGRITVSSGSGAPSGRIFLVVKGKGVVGVAKVRNGVATVSFGKKLKGNRTYEVTAIFVGDKNFRGSTDSAHYTVVKKRHKPRR